MDLRQYSLERAAKPNGFRNAGNTCFFNSLLQCLLSCTSIFDVLREHAKEEHIAKNPLAKRLLALYDQSTKEHPGVVNQSKNIWLEVLRFAQTRKDKVTMRLGQQEDAHEGLMMLLDIMESLPRVRQLFVHRYRTRILCQRCEEFVVDRREDNTVFEVQPDLKNDQDPRFSKIDPHYNKELSLNEFLRLQNSSVDKQHRCEKCGMTSMKFKTVNLCMVPEILPIAFKKYQRKIRTPFPEILEFAAKGDPNRRFRYCLVAQSEHSGGPHGGHYWAICKRKDGWYRLDDMSVTKATPGATPNTYMIFYHFEGIRILGPDDPQYQPVVKGG